MAPSVSSAPPSGSPSGSPAGSPAGSATGSALGASSEPAVDPALGPGMDPAGACPCGTGRPYGRCCGRWHTGPQALQAPDAESLMRSRYSAYVLGLTPYLQATWHPSTRPATLEPLEPGLRWLGLEVRAVQAVQPLGSAGGAGGTAPVPQATVEFVARSKLGGRAHRLHEISRFVREGGRWFYVDGQIR